MSQADALIEDTNETMESLNATILNAKHATEETVKINTHVRLLIEATEGLVKESKITQNIANKLANVIKELESIAIELNSESEKFKV
jgi:hypothetical protein